MSTHKPQGISGSLIRAARADDAEFLAWAIAAASRGHLGKGWFDIALNQPEERCLEFLKQLSVTKTRSWWHYSRFIVAEISGEPVAALSAFQAGEAYPLSQAAMDEAAEVVGYLPRNDPPSGGVVPTSSSVLWAAMTIAGRWKTSRLCRLIASEA